MTESEVVSPMSKWLKKKKEPGKYEHEVSRETAARARRESR